MIYKVDISIYNSIIYIIVKIDETFFCRSRVSFPLIQEFACLWTANARKKPCAMVIVVQSISYK